MAVCMVVWHVLTHFFLGYSAVERYLCVEWTVLVWLLTPLKTCVVCVCVCSKCEHPLLASHTYYFYDVLHSLTAADGRGSIYLTKPSLPY